ncbi:ribosome-associated GTPase [Pedobacter sp. BAL39]|nr:ribosome-associated GTPase [Pedobacter sp. BAL39]
MTEQRPDRDRTMTGLTDAATETLPENLNGDKTLIIVM